MKIFCEQHKEIKPVMVHFNTNRYGKEYICLRCKGVRAFGKGIITEVHYGTYGAIVSDEGARLFFHIKKFKSPFIPVIDQKVIYEVGFVEDGRIQAINVAQEVSNNTAVQRVANDFDNPTVPRKLPASGPNDAVIKKCVHTFTNPYGISIKSSLLIETLAKENSNVTKMGVVIRDAITKTILLAANMPVSDVTDQILYVPIDDGVRLEALPFLVRDGGSSGSSGKRVETEGHIYYTLTERAFSLKAHYSLQTRGVVDSYDPKTNTGFITRVRGGIFFKKEWCHTPDLYRGREVRFIPVVTRKGLQGRCVEGV